MRKLTSGVYYVDYKNIQTFIENANESGWKWTSSTSVEDELAKHTTTKSIIPFSLNITGNQIRYWSAYMCHNQEEVLNQMENWTDWNWTDKYIEYYKPKTILL